VRIRVQRLANAHDLPLPAPASLGSAGIDLRAAVEAEIEIAPGHRARVPTGLAVEIPPGWEAQVRPRSGLAHRFGVTMPNAPGTIDSDYRGEIAVLLLNLGDRPFRLQRGDRIAQLVLSRVEPIEWLEVDELESSSRGDGGFGSTGTT
jgi:dUTP pyrophosphatase